jgi:hypothetical protein
MDNYEVSRDRAQKYFLNFDQQAIIDRWGLHSDADYLYLTFVCRPYRICRKTGCVERLHDGMQADFSEVLSIFDLLCHKGEDQFLTGKYAPVNSLRGCPVSVGVNAEFHGKSARYFDDNPELVKTACIALGGTAVSMGDIGFVLPIFDRINVILKFYHSDEDFPASITFLWDENTLQFLFYETVFYIAGYLLTRISEEMRKAESEEREL